MNFNPMVPPGYGYPMTGGYGGGMPPQYGGAQYPAGPAGGDQTAMHTFSMCMALIQPLMDFLFTMLAEQGGAAPQPPTGGTEGGGGAGGTEEPEELETPTSNTEALELLSEYEDELPNGNLNQKELKEFAKKSDAPEAVKQAALMLAEDEELYQLLCIKSGNDPDKGFSKKEILEKGGWEDIEADLDDLEPFEDEEDAMEVLEENAEKIAKLSGSADDISREDLEKIALGEGGRDLDDPELQAAARKILLERGLFDDLDEMDDADPANTPSNTTEGSFHKNAFAEWLAGN